MISSLEILSACQGSLFLREHISRLFDAGTLFDDVLFESFCIVV